MENAYVIIYYICFVSIFEHVKNNKIAFITNSEHRKDDANNSLFEENIPNDIVSMIQNIKHCSVITQSWNNKHLSSGNIENDMHVALYVHNYLVISRKV